MTRSVVDPVVAAVVDVTVLSAGAVRPMPLTRPVMIAPLVRLPEREGPVGDDELSPQAAHATTTSIGRASRMRSSVLATLSSFQRVKQQWQGAFRTASAGRNLELEHDAAVDTTKVELRVSD